MTKKSLIQKLRILPNHRVIVLYAPQGYLDSLGEIPEEIEITDNPEGAFDFVQLFFKDKANSKSTYNWRSTLSNTMDCCELPT
jgi:hypothetical protein